ncbi:MAG: helix-turn-helix domain-containing protein [Acidobacteriia bacterium]|nr:helix-turn-helix domain-containing protein [Terriglobia bacterium]
MEKDFYPRFGQTLRKARKTSGLSQEDLAKAVGLNRTSVSNIEKGRQKILLHTFCDLLRVLNVEPRDLIPLPIEKKPPANPDLSGYRPAVRGFISRGIGLPSREESKNKTNANSPLQDSEARKRVAR